MTSNRVMAETIWIERRIVLALTIAFGLCAISACSVALGWYYDDEIGNIYVAGLDVGSIIRRANSEDVHPPGQYLINKALFQLFRDWRMVKLAGGVLQAAAAAFFFAQLWSRLGRPTRLMTAALLTTCATLIMWGASLRWYAYFNPLFIVAAALVLSEKPRRLSIALALAAISVAMFYIAYAALVAIPALWIVYLLRCFDYRWPQRSDKALISQFVFILIAIGILILPQFLVFIHVHIHNGGEQKRSPLVSLIGVAYTIILGNAVFPLASLAIAAAIAIVISAAIGLPRLLREPLYRDVALLLLIGGFLLGLSGLGGKFRNAVFLYPLALVLMGAILAQGRPAIRWPALLIIAAFQWIGMDHVIFHRDTSKGSYNQPYKSVLDSLVQHSTACPGQTWVFNHDVVLTYLLQRNGFLVSSPYAPSPDADVEITPGSCVMVVHSSGGALPEKEYERFSAFNGAAGLLLFDTARIGYDNFASQKRRMEGVTPDYYFTVLSYKADQNITIPAWRADPRPQ